MTDKAGKRSNDVRFVPELSSWVAAEGLGVPFTARKRRAVSDTLGIETLETAHQDPRTFFYSARHQLVLEALHDAFGDQRESELGQLLRIPQSERVPGHRPTGQRHRADTSGGRRSKVVAFKADAGDELPMRPALEHRLEDAQVVEAQGGLHGGEEDVVEAPGGGHANQMVQGRQEVAPGADGQHADRRILDLVGQHAHECFHLLQELAPKAAVAANRHVDCVRAGLPLAVVSHAATQAQHLPEAAEKRLQRLKRRDALGVPQVQARGNQEPLPPVLR
eukprot:scaffold1733_cov257-Pinguiococcus_pyrenoidosus.AAC.4